jgi:hypothetical protein
MEGGGPADKCSGGIRRVETAEILSELIGFARDAGLEVRRVGRSSLADLEVPAVSGTCRVRGAVWVVLASADPLDLQIDVLSEALRTHAGDLLESRYLPPAVRERISRGRDAG